MIKTGFLSLLNRAGCHPACPVPVAVVMKS